MNAALRSAPATPPLQELFDGVEDLMRRVADVDNPEIRRIRAKVHATMVAAKNSFEEGAHRGRRQAIQLADGDESHGARALEAYPANGVGVGLLIGLGLGLILPDR